MVVLSLSIGVPLLVRARALGDITQCEANVGFLGSALMNYQGANGHFPQAAIPNEDLPALKRLSWLIDILPFIDQIQLRINRAKAWDDDDNRKAEAYVTDDYHSETQHSIELGAWPSLLCPANPNKLVPPNLGFTHYVGVTGVGKESPVLPADYPGLGVFGYDRKTRLADVQDGISTTIMVIETATDNGPWTAAGPPTVRYLEPERAPYLGRDGQFSALHRMSKGLMAFYYPTGTNALFVDGSVRALVPDLDPRILEAMATIAGGECLQENNW
jgi:prepilin-type processing-associated H-X9-DG protein